MDKENRVFDFTIDLRDFAFNKKSEGVKEIIRRRNSTVVAEDVIESLEQNELFEWFNIVYENRDSVTELDSALGTKGFNIFGLLNHAELYKVLSDNPTTYWGMPLVFLSQFYMNLSASIDENFDSDEEFIEVTAQESDKTRDELERVYSMYQNIESRFDFLAVESDLLFAKASEYLTLQILPLINITEWDETPEVNQYIEIEVYKNKDQDRGTIVSRVTEQILKQTYLSEIAPDIEEDSEEDILLEEYVEIRVEHIDHDEIVNKKYSDHPILPHNEGSVVYGSKEQDKLTVYDERPTIK